MVNNTIFKCMGGGCAGIIGDAEDEKVYRMASTRAYGSSADEDRRSMIRRRKWFSGTY